MASFSRLDTYNKIVTLVAQKLSLQESAINQDSGLQDLGADSLDLVEIIMKLEEEFGIEIDDQKAEQLHTINQVVDYVHSLRKI